MKAGLHGKNVETLPISSSFNFAKGQKTLAMEKSRIWFPESPPLLTQFSIPFLMSLPQIKNLGVSLPTRNP